MTVIWWAFGYHSKLGTSWLSFPVPTWELFFSEHSFISLQSTAVPGNIHLQAAVCLQRMGWAGCVLLWGLESCSVHMPTWRLAFQGTLGLKINSVYFKVNVMLFLEKFHASKHLKKRKTSYDLLFLEIFDSWNCARCRTRQGCAAEVAIGIGEGSWVRTDLPQVPLRSAVTMASDSFGETGKRWNCKVCGIQLVKSGVPMKAEQMLFYKVSPCLIPMLTLSLFAHVHCICKIALL